MVKGGVVRPGSESWKGAAMNVIPYLYKQDLNNHLGPAQRKDSLRRDRKRRANIKRRQRSNASLRAVKCHGSEAICSLLVMEAEWIAIPGLAAARKPQRRLRHTVPPILKPRHSSHNTYILIHYTIINTQRLTLRRPTIHVIAAACLTPKPSYAGHLYPEPPRTPETAAWRHNDAKPYRVWLQHSLRVSLHTIVAPHATH